MRRTFAGIGAGSRSGLRWISVSIGHDGLRDQRSMHDGIDFSLPLREAREQFERAYLLHQLGVAGGSVGKLAKAVGMERTHLYRKLKDLGVDPRTGAREG